MVGLDSSKKKKLTMPHSGKFFLINKKIYEEVCMFTDELDFFGHVLEVIKKVIRWVIGFAWNL